MATRLRRSADSLLVVSGTIDQQLSGMPTRLADVIRSALAEIEGYRAVQLGEIVDVSDAGFSVVCADGRISVLRVKGPDGGKVSAGDFVKSSGLAAGTRLV